MKTKINKKLLLLFTFLFTAIVSSLEFPASFEWKEVAGLDIQRSERMQELNNRFGVVRIHSLNHHRLIGHQRNGVLRAKAFFSEEAGGDYSEVMLRDHAGNLFLLQSKQAGVEAEMIEAYSSLDFVVAVEENIIGELHVNEEVQRFGVSSAPEKTVFPTTNAPEKRIVVAIVDSGIEMTHPALVDVFWNNPAETAGKRGKDDDKNGFTDDLHGWNFAEKNNDITDSVGHGTHVAGVIAAKGQESTNMAGVNPDGVSLMVLKVVDGDGRMRLSDVVSALLYANEQDIDAINMSFGFKKPSSILHSVIKKLDQKGILLIAASGNTTNESKSYPAAFPEVLSVGSTEDLPMQRNSFDNEAWPDIRLQGRLLSTLPGKTYGLRKGSSQSAALATGLFTLLKQGDPEITAAEVARRISRSVTIGKDNLHAVSDLGEAEEWILDAVRVIDPGTTITPRERARWRLETPITKTEIRQLLYSAYPESNIAVAVEQSFSSFQLSAYSPHRFLSIEVLNDGQSSLVRREDASLALMRLHARLFSGAFPTELAVLQRSDGHLSRGEFLEFLRASQIDRT